MELDQAIQALMADIKAGFAKADEQQKSNGSITAELKTELDKLVKRCDELESKRSNPGGREEKGVATALRECEPLAKLMKDRRGSASVILTAKQADELFEEKTTIATGTGTGYATGGVLELDRRPGVVLDARRVLRMRNVIPARACNFGKVYWVKVSAAPTKASFQTEGSGKAENQMAFTAVGETMRVLATFITATRQVLEDWGELEGVLKTALKYAVDKEDDSQILNGDGTGENYNGLVTTATAFDTALTPASAGWNYADMIGRAMQQIATADEIEPGFCAMNPVDWWNVRLIKDTNGNYIFGSPAGRGAPGIFDLTPVVTNALPSGKFLVGSSQAAAAEIRDNMGVEIMVSTEHANNFTENKITIRAERRSLIATYRPGAFIYGTFTKSPA